MLILEEDRLGKGKKPSPSHEDTPSSAKALVATDTRPDHKPQQQKNQQCFNQNRGQGRGGYRGKSRNQSNQSRP